MVSHDEQAMAIEMVMCLVVGMFINGDPSPEFTERDVMRLLDGLPPEQVARVVTQAMLRASRVTGPTVGDEMSRLVLERNREEQLQTLESSWDA